MKENMVKICKALVGVERAKGEQSSDVSCNAGPKILVHYLF